MCFTKSFKKWWDSNCSYHSRFRMEGVRVSGSIKEMRFDTQTQKCLRVGRWWRGWKNKTKWWSSTNIMERIELKRHWALSVIPSLCIHTYHHTTVTGWMVEAPFALNERPQKKQTCWLDMHPDEEKQNPDLSTTSSCLIYWVHILSLFWIKEICWRFDALTNGCFAPFLY